MHILHITTARELDLFDNGERSKKTVTAEACAHHLLFDESDYATLGMQIKCNPAIKSRADRDALRAAVAAGVIDVLATDHAPHLPEEKNLAYEKAAAGMPLVEYAMPAFLELVADGELQITKSPMSLSVAHTPSPIFLALPSAAISAKGITPTWF